eukprot:2425336-Prymnesium_polylepis.1
MLPWTAIRCLTAFTDSLATHSAWRAISCRRQAPCPAPAASCRSPCAAAASGCPLLLPLHQPRRQLLRPASGTCKAAASHPCRTPTAARTACTRSAARATRCRSAASVSAGRAHRPCTPGSRRG